MSHERIHGSQYRERARIHGSQYHERTRIHGSQYHVTTVYFGRGRVAAAFECRLTAHAQSLCGIGEEHRRAALQICATATGEGIKLNGNWSFVRSLLAG